MAQVVCKLSLDIHNSYPTLWTSPKLCAVSVTNAWIPFGCDHSCFDGTRWKEEREDKGAVSLLFQSPRESNLISLEICCCDPDIISCPTTFYQGGLRSIRGLRSWHLVQQTEGIEVWLLLSRYLSTAQMFLWGISRYLKDDLRHVLRSMPLLCHAKENIRWVEERCAFKDIPAGLLGLSTCVCMSVCSSFIVHLGGDEWYRTCSKMVISPVIINPSCSTHHLYI